MNKRYGIMVRHWIFFAIFSGVMLIAAGAAVYNKHIPYIHLILMAAGVVVIALSLLLKLKRRRVMEKYLDDVAYSGRSHLKYYKRVPSSYVGYKYRRLDKMV